MSANDVIKLILTYPAAPGTQNQHLAFRDTMYKEWAKARAGSAENLARIPRLGRAHIVTIRICWLHSEDVVKI